MYVYILGAGASKPDGVPVTSKIFGAAFSNLWIKGGDGSYRFVTTDSPFEEDSISEFLPVFELFDEWEGTCLAQKWSALKKEIQIPLPRKLAVDTRRFEHFYSKLYRISRGFEHYNLKSEGEMKAIWRKAKWLFYHTIGSAGWNPEPRWYQIFVEKALARPGLHCVISFNADTLLDDRLDRPCSSLKELEWTYGIKFGVQSDEMQHYEFRHNAKILYCKPHGSLNWGVTRKTGQASLHHSAESCNYKKLFLDQDSSEDALVIPPIEEKELPPPLKEVWKNALDAISRAEELCVIGYSAPETDNKEAVELLGKASTSLRRVVIANPCESDRGRILGLLSTSSEENVVEYGGFEEYLDAEFKRPV